MAEETKTIQSQALESAWRRYAELDIAADRASEMHKRTSLAVIVLGVLATLIAVLSDNLTAQLDAIPLFGEDFTAYSLLLVLLSILPLLGTAVLAFGLRMKYGERWQALRAGAEEIRKEIYFYRTVLQKEKTRDDWLVERVADIQRQVHELFSGDLVIQPYTKEKLPHINDPGDLTSDPGFFDLLAHDYIRFRVDDQKRWHNQKMLRFQNNRVRLLVFTYTFSLVGAILGLLGWLLPALPIWVAVTTAVAAAISAWVELRRMDATIQNYSTVVLELGIVRDFWTGLDGEKRTGDQFFKLVGAVERVLWTQHNKFIAEMRRAVAALEEDHADLLETALAAPVHAEIEDALKMENYNEAERERKRIERLKQEFEVKRLAAMEGLEEGVERLENLEDLEQAARKLMGADQRADGRITAATRRALRARPHAFVVMPFGRKKGLDGAWIDFNAVYQELIKPALIEAGFEPFRADDATETGDILTDMFQELLLADLVICDLSIDNANVFYELGIRHAFRKRGVVHIQSGRAYMPFDIFNVRTIPYQLDSSGKPDSEHLRKDIQMVARVCTDTYNSDRDAIHSPVFNLLSGLDEPNRRALRTAAATGFWREYNEWREHMEIAKRQKRIGDILLLTEEIRNPLIKEEAIGEAGEALKTLKQHELAIAQYRAGQELNDRNHNFRREEAFHLNRLGRVDEAIVKLEKIIEMQPGDSEAIAALGRIYRQMWSEIWTGFTRKDKRKREAFASAHWLIKSVNTYLKAYKVDQNNYYPGINALTWSTVLINLADDCNDISNPDVEHIRDWLPQLNGAVQFALERETDAESTDYWALASLAELYVTSALDPTKVERAYKKALTASKKSAFYLESSLGQLNVLESLGFRPDYVKVGKDILLEELQRIRSEDGDEKPSAETDQPASQEFIYLFSGHMLDTQDANPQVFPPEMEAEVVKRLTAAMTEWDADANDVGVVVGAAAGGDILFIEECLRRDMLVEVLLPYDESTYVAKYIAEISDEWVTRYYDCRNHPRVAIYIQTDHIGDPKRGDDPIERNNRWGMFTALAKGVDRLRFLALWDGRSDPGSYGAIINDMIDDVRGIGGRVVHLNTSKFDYFNNRRPGRSKARELIISRLEQGFAEDEPAAEVDPAGQPTAADMAMTEESESKIAGNGASIKAKE